MRCRTFPPSFARISTSPRASLIRFCISAFCGDYFPVVYPSCTPTPPRPPPLTVCLCVLLRVPPYSSGTRIVLFNLKTPVEFDFEYDPVDIRMMGSLGDDDDDKPRTSSRRPIFQQHRPGQQMTLDVPEDYSLRSYMEVLYLRPTVAFTLRGWAPLLEGRGGGAGQRSVTG